MPTAAETIACLYAEELAHPVTFNQKLRWKMRHDRNPLLTVTADKYAVHDYIKQKGLGHLLKNRYWFGSNPALIPFDHLPARYAVKSTHRSGDVILMDNGIDRTTRQPISGDEIIAKSSEWLSRRHWNEANEWAYSNITPRIVIEELLITDTHSPPPDFKFLCFNGKPAVVEVDEGRFGDESRNGASRDSFYDVEWNHLPFVWADWPGAAWEWKPGRPDFPKPSNLFDMISVAAALSRPFDFVRVDLYSHAGRIYFGELTHYPSAGIGDIEPPSYDIFLGSLWTLRDM